MRPLGPAGGCGLQTLALRGDFVAHAPAFGIATPEICSEEEAARTGYPCTAALNPFSYEERVGMLAAALQVMAVGS